MRVYSASLEEFRDKLVANELFRSMEARFPSIIGHTVAQNEAAAWRASLPRLDLALRGAALRGDVHITLEERIPYFSKRIDACLFGHTEEGAAHTVIIELKGWGDAKALDSGNVETFIGGAYRERPHPSAQANGYQKHIEDFRRAFQGESRIGLASCAYCHNYPGIIPDEGLFHPRFDAVRVDSPTFGERDAGLLAKYLRVRLERGHGAPVLEAYDRAGIGPSQSLIDHAGQMIREQNVFRLLDDQIAANNEIIRAIGRASERHRKQVVLVRGGPGTGKSVLALNALGELLRREFAEVYLVSGSAAFTYGLRRVLGMRLEGQVRFTDFCWNAAPDSIDALVVDEAHRIRAKSVPRVAGHLRPKIPQVDELIRAARLSVFFVDENQIISPDEVGEPALIEAAAVRQGAAFSAFTLSGQFRCSGSVTYMDWLDDLLDQEPNRTGIKLMVPVGFDFDVMDSPHDLLAWVRAANDEKPNSARLLAGWCWKWSDPLPDRLVEDIVIGDFRFPWESKLNKRPPPGIPEAKYWALDPAGVDQAGTVYSVQGFEMDHVGVIVGPDLVIRNGEWVAEPRKNFRNALRAKRPEVALPYLKRIYRTLLSRPMRSCRVFSTDDETRAFIASQIVRP
jgi:uncharacterized protein